MGNGSGENESAPKHPDYSRRVKIAALASLVLTGVSSVTGTYLANSGQATEHDPLASAGYSVGTTSATVGVGPQDVVPGAPLPGIRVDFEDKTTVPGGTIFGTKTASEGFETVYMEYAREFGEDPNAKKITDGDKGAEEAAGYIIDLLGEGYMPDQIEIGVTGKASDENIITVEKPHGDDAGFGTEEPKNEELADKRAEAVRDRILEILKQETGIDFSNSIELDGVEVQDAALAEEIGNIAANKNMSLYDFVDTYNSGDRGSLGLNAEEQEVMSRLEANRGADIDVSATREVVEELPDTVTIERKGSLVIIAIFIPPFLFRIRLRKPEEEADPAPVPTPEPNPVEPWYVGKTKLVDPKAKARSGYGSATYHNKQPTTLNQGSRRQGSTSVNRRGRK